MTTDWRSLFSLLFIYHHICSGRARSLATMRKKTGQLGLVTLLTGQQSGAARSSDGFNFPFLPLLKSTVRAVQVQVRPCGSFPPLYPLRLAGSHVKRGVQHAASRAE